jgi:hypothetical protein
MHKGKSVDMATPVRTRSGDGRSQQAVGLSGWKLARLEKAYAGRRDGEDTRR